MALRRWKPFLGAFQHIDAAIEASSGDGVSRDEFRKARGRIVELLCDAAATGDGGGDGEAAAEGLGLLLDEAMEGALATLHAVPAGRIPTLLAAPGGLVGAVGALMKGHASERVRGLARDVVREWKLSVGAELARARTAMDVLNGISDDTRAKHEEAKKIIPEEKKEQPLRPKKTAVVSSSRRICTAESYAPLCKKRAPAVVSTSNTKPPSASMKTPAAVPPQPSKKPTPAAVVSVTAEQRKMNATKRKLEERYQETEDAKRRRTVQVIKPPRPEKKAGQRQSSAHLAMRARGQAASGTAERRFMKPLSRPIRV
ncbi:hypothetical protein HU200_063801 [Digitaria exilis]|uniref:TFIIS N-terminal domain-containing protein n=1 Tax=Digitaria exilis TaxID=1010633 RepID=A0A835A7C1_9POAL|nr:hypothetical protein HU200_063801 [Digitaria exilis]CAB3489912.1 unnamed protein product [Digitaria exilis]